MLGIGVVELLALLLLMAVPIGAVTIASVRYVRSTTRRDDPPS